MRVITVELGNVLTKAASFAGDGPDVRLEAVASSPTTHYPPLQDVGIGLRDALTRLGEALGSPLVDGDGSPYYEQMLVSCQLDGALVASVLGVIGAISTQSACRALLNAGGSLAEVVSLDDVRGYFDRRRALGESAVDVALVAGGIDTDLLTFGRGRQVVSVAELLRDASPPRRFGPTRLAPVVYVGGKEAEEEVLRALRGREAVVGPNVRPTVEREELNGCVELLTRFYRERVIPHHPAFSRHDQCVSSILPSGYAMSRLVEIWSREGDWLVVDAGATGIALYSTLQGILTRTYLDLARTDIAQTLRDLCEWLSLRESGSLGDHILQTHVCPGSVPVSFAEELMEGLYLAFCLALARDQHSRRAATLYGVQQVASMDRVFVQRGGGESLLKGRLLDGVIVTGGRVPFHNPGLSSLILSQGLQGAGTTPLYFDRRGYLPHLARLAAAGLAGWTPAALVQRGWLEPVGTHITPLAADLGRPCRDGAAIAQVVTRWKGGAARAQIRAGSVETLPLPAQAEIEIYVHPRRGWDFGAGPGHSVFTVGRGGPVGLLLDGRDPSSRATGFPLRRLADWITTTGAAGRDRAEDAVLRLGTPTGARERREERASALSRAL